MRRRCRANTAGSVPLDGGHPTLGCADQEALHERAIGPRRGAGPMIDPRTISRRSFMRRMLGAGVGLLSLEFVGGSIAFLWPASVEGLGIEHEVGTLDQISTAFPAWPTGEPIEFRPAR